MHGADRFSRLIACPARSACRELDDRSIGIADIQAREIMPVERSVDRDAQVGKAALPAKKVVVVGDVKREVMSAANPWRASRGIRPLEERHERSGLCTLVSEVEMVCGRSVEVDRPFYKSKAQHPCVEISGALGRLADDRDVMNGKN